MSAFKPECSHCEDPQVSDILDILVVAAAATHRHPLGLHGSVSHEFWAVRSELRMAVNRVCRLFYSSTSPLFLTPGTSFFQRFWRQGGSLAYWEERGGLKRGSRAS
jgi:hypothetical protein